MAELTGKVALVTGASRGIGRATAERLSKDGAAVVINYSTSAGEANETVRAIRESGGQATAIQADVANLADIRRLFRETTSRLGRLDILIANAGYARFGPMEEVTEEDFDRTFAVNAKGTFFCLREALRCMTAGGKIVCVASVGTVHNPPGGGCYFGSKGAVEQFCRILGKEVAARGIAVNAISPGAIDTEMLRAVTDAAARRELALATPMQRLGEPAEIADVIAFLVSDAARFVTRQNVAVDGGLISR